MDSEKGRGKFVPVQIGAGGHGNVGSIAVFERALDVFLAKRKLTGDACWRRQIEAEADRAKRRRSKK